MAKSIVITGAPSAAGSFTDAASRAAAAIRQAGLVPALERCGLEVRSRDDLPVFPFHDDPEHPTCRNLPQVVAAIRATADEVAAALPGGFVLMLGGDCSLLPAVLGGLRRHVDGPVGLVFVDAHGDLNTPQTTPSGRVAGMALALALGHGHRDLLEAAGEAPLVEPHHAALLGFRDLDPGERRLVDGGVGLALGSHDIVRAGPAQATAQALRLVEEVPFVVHLDLDVVDASEMLTQVPPAGGRGLTREQLSTVLRGLLSSPQASALCLTGFDPDRDRDGQMAREVVGLLSGVLAEAA
jgi:arginase